MMAPFSGFIYNPENVQQQGSCLIIINSRSSTHSLAPVYYITSYTFAKTAVFSVVVQET